MASIVDWSQITGYSIQFWSIVLWSIYSWYLNLHKVIRLTDYQSENQVLLYYRLWTILSKITCFGPQKDSVSGASRHAKKAKYSFFVLIWVWYENKSLWRKHNHARLSLVRSRTHEVSDRIWSRMSGIIWKKMILSGIWTWNEWSCRSAAEKWWSSSSRRWC